jgi:hypothetical protein
LRQNRRAILSVKDKISAVLIIARVLLKPGESRFRKVQTLRIARQVVAGGTSRYSVSRAMPMFGHLFERLSTAIEQSVPTAITVVPHPLIEIAKSVRSDLRQLRPVGKMARSSGSGKSLSRLILEHLGLRSRGSPAMVEITEKPAVLAVNTAREPDTYKVAQLRLQLVSQELFHGRTHAGTRLSADQFV